MSIAPALYRTMAYPVFLIPAEIPFTVDLRTESVSLLRVPDMRGFLKRRMKRT